MPVLLSAAVRRIVFKIHPVADEIIISSAVLCTAQGSGKEPAENDQQGNSAAYFSDQVLFSQTTTNLIVVPHQTRLSALSSSQHFSAWGPGLWQRLPTTSAVQIDKQPIKINY